MANLKAMHSISEVMQTPISSYVLIMCGLYLIPAVRAASPLKEKRTTATQIKSVKNHVDNVIERFAADQIHSDFSTS